MGSTGSPCETECSRCCSTSATPVRTTASIDSSRTPTSASRLPSRNWRQTPPEESPPHPPATLPLATTSQIAAAFIPVSDISQGYTELNNSPHTRRVKTVFLAMCHAIDDMNARQECMDIMHELFRQFMSVLIQEKTIVEEEHIYLDPRISFQEIDRYFFSGCACAFIQIASDTYTALRYNKEEWD